VALHIEPNTAYSLKEIEKGLGVLKVFTLREWIKGGKLRASKMGKAYIVLGSDLLEAMKAVQTKGPSKAL